MVGCRSLIKNCIDQSLLWQQEEPDGTSRFVFLETIREYGQERLEAAGEAPAMRLYHAHHLLEAHPRTQPRPQ